VAVNPKPDFAGFGWFVGCAGRKPVQVREDVKAMVEWATDTCATYFPRERGYRVVAQSPAGPSNGVQLTVTRGDFRATVALESILDPTRRGPQQRAVRMFGRASSEGLDLAERSAQPLVSRCRSLGFASALAAFIGVCWTSIGVQAPLFMLGGLLMVVVALLMLLGGGTLGGWIGERLAELRFVRATSEVQKNPFLGDDLRRWKALARQFASQRLAITGSNTTVFRALPEAKFKRTTGSNAPVRLATSSCSFS
jgi:hypothetical protein